MKFLGKVFQFYTRETEGGGAKSDFFFAFCIVTSFSS